MWPELNPTEQDALPTRLIFNSPNDKPSVTRHDAISDLSSAKVLLQRLHSGDCVLFYDLTKGFLPNVYTFVRSMIGDASTADDICQQTFLNALQKVHQLRELRCLRSWVMQIAVNEVRMVWRASRRHPKLSIEEFVYSDTQLPIPAKLINPRETPIETLARKELVNLLEHALQQLPPKYRSVFWLRDVEQLSGAETAAILSITPNCVKTRVMRARLKLRDHLAPILSREAASAKLPRAKANQRRKDAPPDKSGCCVRSEIRAAARPVDLVKFNATSRVA
jgi:RNA polymerase sigma-70 factor (ECF subfamily)